MTHQVDRSTWAKVKFDDVVRNANATPGSSPGRAIAMEDLIPGELTVRTWGEASDTTFTRLVKPGQTLFGKRRAYQRKVAYATFEAVCSGDILTLEPADGSLLLAEILPFICMTEPFYEHAVGTSAGSLSPRTRWSDLASYEFLLPPLDEQKRIADLLWSIESALTASDAMESALTASKHAVLGERVDSWQGKRVLLSSLAELQRGASYASTDYREPGHGRPFLNLKCVTRLAEFAPEGVKWVDAAVGSGRLVSPGDLFLACTDLTPGRLLVGAPFYVSSLPYEQPAAFSMDLVRVVPKVAGVTREQLFLALSSPAARAHARRNTTGSTVGHLNVDGMGALQVPDPVDPMWDSLQRVAMEIDHAVSATRSERDALRAVRRMVLGSFVGGEG